MWRLGAGVSKGRRMYQDGRRKEVRKSVGKGVDEAERKTKRLGMVRGAEKSWSEKTNSPHPVADS